MLPYPELYHQSCHDPRRVALVSCLDLVDKDMPSALVCLRCCKIRDHVKSTSESHDEQSSQTDCVRDDNEDLVVVEWVHVETGTPRTGS